MALDLLLSLLKNVPALNYAARGQAQPYVPQQEALAAQMQGIGDAYINPNNAYYQNIYKQKMAQNQQSLAETIAEAQRQNRKSTQLGRTPLFSPERGGETLFRSLMGQQGQIQQQADQQTQQQLAGARGAYGTASDAYRLLAPQKAAKDYSQNVAPFDFASGVVKDFFGNDKNQPQQNYYQGTGNTSVGNNIRWNGPRLDQMYWSN